MINLSEFDWYWFKGNSVQGSLLQSVSCFRSRVLFDSGFRKDFGPKGKNYGDISFTDFESYHIIAAKEGKIYGTIRVTPPHAEKVAEQVLGAEDYLKLLKHIGTEANKVYEINRLMIDQSLRKCALGRTLMYAAIGLMEAQLNRSNYTVIGSAGNCTKQAHFFTKYTDYYRISNVNDRAAPIFNDTITFLVYKNAPYIKGKDEIDSFTKMFMSPQNPQFSSFELINHPLPIMAQA
ncbi:MAG: GNAT family N-acetyltransferase [Bdellovibrionaceae bacterium]|nr:GNAT family N-acetyltransferase [Pseudobdellovibrionaceae bacterium]